MLIAEVVARVKRDFGDEYNTFITDTDIYNWIYDAELEIIRTSGKESTTTVAANLFPATIAGNISLKRLVFNGRALVYVEREELDARGIDPTSPITNGEPNFWYTVEGVAHIYPPTSLTGNVTIYYNKTPTLTSGPPPSPTTMTVPDRFHVDVLNYCLGMAHGKNHDGERERVYMERFEKNVGLRSSENDAADTPLYKGSDPMDYSDYMGIY